MAKILDPLPSITDENVANIVGMIKMFAKYFAIPLADIYNESFMS
jgi:hypothetical protein